jgi:hypothetical protein
MKVGTCRRLGAVRVTRRDGKEARQLAGAFFVLQNSVGMSRVKMLTKVTLAQAANSSSTHFHRSVIRTGTEFESRMSHLFASLPARIGDSGY